MESEFIQGQLEKELMSLHATSSTEHEITGNTVAVNTLEDAERRSEDSDEEMVSYAAAESDRVNSVVIFLILPSINCFVCVKYLWV